MALVVGLGNPGARYARSRHNVAWRLVGRLRERWRAAPVEGGGGSYRAWRALLFGRTVHLMTPLTFMSRSGEALEAWRAEHPIALDGLLAVVDDVYLPVGLIRLRGHGMTIELCWPAAQKRLVVDLFVDRIDRSDTHFRSEFRKSRFRRFMTA